VASNTPRIRSLLVQASDSTGPEICRKTYPYCDCLHAKNGQTLSELCKGLDMARLSVTQHLRLLEDANLISVQRRGREKLHYFKTKLERK
jgi:DNA-binding transcriptional ArsR family regulator